ncbi:hypothetical protein D3C87_622080 [compost metagenome]
MPYSINRTDGTLLTNVQDYTRDTESTTLTLLGRGTVDYGESVAENFVHMLESFASPTPPANPLQGQTWFHTFDPGPPIAVVNKLKVFDGTTWINVGGAQSSVNPPDNPEPGDLWYNIEDSTIYYWDGYNWKKVGGPYTGVPGGQDPAELPDDEIIPPPANPGEGDLWWMLPERKLWAFDSSLKSLSSFPPKVPRVDGSLVPNGWVLIGPQGIQDPNDPNGGSWTETGQETVIDPVTGEEIVIDLFMVVLDGKIVSVWVPQIVKLKENKIKGMDFAAWADPYNPDATTLTLQPGVNQNHGAGMVFNGQVADAERLNGLNASQFLRSDVDTAPIVEDIVLDFGSKEKHWLRAFFKYIYAGDSDPDGEADISEVNIFGMAKKAELCDTAEKAKMFDAAKSMKTEAATSDVEVIFTDLFATEANEYVGTAMLTEQGKDAVKAIAEEVTNDVVGQLPSGSYVPLDASSVPTGQHDMGNAGQRWGTIYANVFDGEATKTRYADVAERYAADSYYPVGTLLSLGGTEEVTATSGAYDYNYFGVRSDKPGYLLNSTAGPDHTHPAVAIAGRVEIRVKGKVAKGQRLVLSDIPGVAVAVEGSPEMVSPFFIVGRALANKETDEEGLVMCVVGMK